MLAKATAASAIPIRLIGFLMQLGETANDSN